MLRLLPRIRSIASSPIAAVNRAKITKDTRTVKSAMPRRPAGMDFLARNVKICMKSMIRITLVHSCCGRPLFSPRGFLFLHGEIGLCTDARERRNGSLTLETLSTGENSALASSGDFFRSWARRSLGFDLRSLALLRIVAPSVYLLELLLHWKYIACMYTDAGMCPRAPVVEDIGEAWSVYLLTGALAGVQVIYLCHMLAVFCLI